MSSEVLSAVSALTTGSAQVPKTPSLSAVQETSRAHHWSVVSRLAPRNRFACPQLPIFCSHQRSVCRDPSSQWHHRCGRCTRLLLAFLAEFTGECSRWLKEKWLLSGSLALADHDVLDVSDRTSRDDADIQGEQEPASRLTRVVTCPLSVFSQYNIDADVVRFQEHARSQRSRTSRTQPAHSPRNSSNATSQVTVSCFSRNRCFVTGKHLIILCSSVLLLVLLLYILVAFLPGNEPLSWACAVTPVLKKRITILLTTLQTGLTVALIACMAALCRFQR